MTNPTAGTSVSGTVTLAADASDSTGISKVQFQMDGTNLGSAATQAPYAVSWDTNGTAAGTHTLTATATDTAGLSTTSNPVSVTTQGNTNSPVISTVQSSSLTASGATITWTTDQATNSQVLYGTTIAYGSSSALSGTLTTTHSVTLAGLTAGTTYHYQVESANANGILSESADNTFTTASSGSGSGGLPKPIGYWKLDEGSGATINDSSGHGHVGSLLGSPTWTNGVIGDALALDGTDDYVSIPTTGSLNIYPLSISFWVKTSSTSGLHGLVNKYYPSSMNGYQVFMNNGNLCAWYFRDSSDYVWDGSGCTLSTAGIADNQWHLVVFTVNSSGGHLYIDGVRTANHSWTGTPGADSSNQALEFGSYPGTTQPYLAGTLDDVNLFNKALSAQQVTTLYNSLPKTQNVAWANI
ncbi:MAG: LamG-like jellyroll fold domain-containing protein, partial [Gammaproteobacteria bacterium]